MSGPSVDPNAVRFEVEVVAVAPDGGRNRLATTPIPNRCLDCGSILVDPDGRITAMLATRNGVLGLVCPTHPGQWRQ